MNQVVAMLNIPFCWLAPNRVLKSVPKVSVLLPVHNGSKYLPAAIDSVLSQDYCDFELLVVDDGSVDDSRDIVRSYDDRRIKLIINERNMGLAVALNRGLAMARGDYVARMDADDVCDPERLSAQFAYMEANSDIAVCGCLMRSFDEPQVVYHFPESQETHFHLLYGPPVAHPSAFIRSSVLKAHGLSYDESFLSSQDYELWSRLADVAKIANLDRVLMSYRSHPGQISSQRSSEQNGFADIVRRRELEKLGIDADDQELANHVKFFRGECEKDRRLMAFSKRWIAILVAANIAAERFSPLTFRRYLSKKWLKLCEQSTSIGPSVLPVLFAPRLFWDSGCSIFDVCSIVSNSLRHKRK